MLFRPWKLQAHCWRLRVAGVFTALGVVGLALALAYGYVHHRKQRQKTLPPPAEILFHCRPFVPAATCRNLTCSGLPGGLCGPVAAAFWTKEVVLVCNYISLQEVDLTSGKIRELQPEPRPPIWVPTGVCVCPAEGLIYVANYLGHDVMVCRRQGDRLQLVQRWSPKGMESPENVACSADGRWVAVADYDGSRLWVFRDGQLAWSYPIPLAHGVALGTDFIVASSLGEQALFRFDLEGHLQVRRGSLGWGPDQYLWPTCMLVVGNDIYVSDARTGKISILDSALHCREWFGGNGPSLGLFNMPYGIMSAREGELLICDTFNHRLVLLDGSRQCRLLVTSQPCPTSWQNQDVCWHFRGGYENRELFFHQGYPGLPSHTWFAGYAQFCSASPGPHALVFPYTGSLFNPGGFPYFCWCLSLRRGEETWLLLGHSQGTGVWIVNREGLCFHRDVGIYLWVREGKLWTSAGLPVDPWPWVGQAAQAFTRYRRLLAAGKEHLEALRQVFWPEWTPADFRRQLDREFVTPAGKAFWKAWQSAVTPKQRRQALDLWDTCLENQEKVLLAELWLRCLLAVE